jgi:hypothetical protein
MPMSELTIGDRLPVTVREIVAPTKPKRKVRILCDVPFDGWECSLQWNPAIEKQVQLLRVGDTVDGWIIRKHESSHFLAVGLSDFGRFPPKPDTLAENMDALLAIKAMLLESSEGRFVAPPVAAIAVVKGLFNRCVKKDQWDWLCIYRAFGFSDDGKAAAARDAFVRFSDSCKAFTKNRATNEVLKASCERLLSLEILQLIAAAAERLSNEAAEWDAVRMPVPARPKDTEQPSEETPDDLAIDGSRPPPTQHQGFALSGPMRSIVCLYGQWRRF